MFDMTRHSSWMSSVRDPLKRCSAQLESCVSNSPAKRGRTTKPGAAKDDEDIDPEAGEDEEVTEVSVASLTRHAECLEPLLIEIIRRDRALQSVSGGVARGDL